MPKRGFDVISGNPPWIELKPPKKDTADDELFARKWIAKERTIAGQRVADAFCREIWPVVVVYQPGWAASPATTLFTLEESIPAKFSAEFAATLRITNLANLRGNLFGKRTIFANDDARI